MKLSVSNDSANSICTAQADIQTKMQPHLFTLDLFSMTYIGPKKSTSDLKNGGLPCSTLSKGKVPIKDSFCLVFLHVHTMHPLPICLTDTLPLVKKKCYNLITIKWEICRISSWTTWCLVESINWYFVELRISASDNLPPILIIPLLSRNVVKLRSLLFFDNGKVLFQVLHAEPIWKAMFRLLFFIFFTFLAFQQNCFI